MKARVHVMLKTGVLDPQGEAVRHALGQLGFDGVEGVRQGKVIELDLAETDKAKARRNKLLGLWAAELLGKTGADADAYAREVVLSDFEEAGHEDVVRKVAGDLGDIADADMIRSKLDELLKVAKDQLMKEV